MARKLLRRGRKLLVRGRKLLLDTLGCRALCCGGCANWRRLVQCESTGNNCGPPPPPLSVWICTTVRCTNGQPLAPGMVVLIDGFCYTVTIETNTNPAGARIISKQPVECIGSCLDERCPQGELFWLGRFCSGDPRPVWVCNVPPSCHIRDCIVVDGGSQPYRFEDIPENPERIFLRFVDMGPPSATCCACLPPGSGVCLTTQLLDFDPTGLNCYNIAQRDCCCSRSPDTGDPLTTYRVTRYEVEQIHERPDGLGGRHRIRMTDSCSMDVLRETMGFGSPDIIQTGRAFPFLSSCYPRCPGGWSAQAPRLLGLDGLQVINGTQGDTWGVDCDGIPGLPGGGSIEARSFVTFFDCHAYRQSAEYVYRDGNNFLTITTRFWFDAVIEGPNPCGNPCPQGVINSGVPVVTDDGVADAPAAPGGCAGCGQGQRRTPV